MSTRRANTGFGLSYVAVAVDGTDFEIQISDRTVDITARGREVVGGHKRQGGRVREVMRIKVAINGGSRVVPVKILTFKSARSYRFTLDQVEVEDIVGVDRLAQRACMAGMVDVRCARGTNRRWTVPLTRNRVYGPAERKSELDAEETMVSSSSDSERA